MTSKNPWTAFLPLIIFNILFVYLALGNGSLELYGENNWMENGQVILLALSTMVFLWAWPQADVYQRTLLLACSIFCVSSILRELDIEKLDVPVWVVLLGSGLGKKIFLAVIWLSLLSRFFIQRQYFIAQLMVYASSLTGKCILLGGVLMLLGLPFDRQWIDTTHGQFYEEIFEFSGYYCLLVAAVFSPASLRAINGRIKKP